MGQWLTARDLLRTQPWQPGEEQQQHKKNSNIITAEIHRFIEEQTPDTVEKLSTEPKKKQKTRGETDPSRVSSRTEAPTISQDLEPSTPAFSLPDRVLKTMTAFYPSSTEDRTGRKIVWKDFLHAMYSLGFRIQKRHGSEWYFEPSWKMNSPITIHEPHPSREMKFDTIRFEANRMARKYGWSSETFKAA